MNDRDERRFERLLRVQTYGKSHAADFAAGSVARVAFASLDSVLVKIAAAKAAQAPNRVSKASLLDALRLDFRAIAKTAQAIELTLPGFAVDYRPPDALTEAATRTHADALLARLEDAAGDTPAQVAAKTALRARFTAYEMAATFVADLRADRDALAHADEHNQLENLEGVTSTAQLGRLLNEAGGLVQQLDAVMSNKYSRMPERLAEWESASHVARGPSGARAAANTALRASGTREPAPVPELAPGTG